MIRRPSTRREFLQSTLIGASMAGSISSQAESHVNTDRELLWGCLLHLSFNMWEEYISPHRPFRGYRPELELSEKLWKDALEQMAKNGFNMVVIDLGDAVQYESHPEIAVKNAWPVKRLKRELSRIRDLGLQPIPKLNFSATHDTWMGDYARMVSTKPYYTFCQDIIAEVSELFDQPPLFHLGMDEETAEHQAHHKYVVVRQSELWRHDLLFLNDEVRKNGSRAWIWSDYLWSHPDEFFTHIPKSIMQSNWYYGETFKENQKYVKAYLDLEHHGYDQIPTASYHAENPKSIGGTVQFCREKIAPQRLKGFLQTIWKPATEEYRSRYLQAISLAGEAKQEYENQIKLKLGK
ncbi:MAG: Tat pathway signal protein [Candidatus Hinthialibacter sp.]